MTERKVKKVQFVCDGLLLNNQSFEGKGTMYWIKAQMEHNDEMTQFPTCSYKVTSGETAFCIISVLHPRVPSLPFAHQ